MFPSFRAVALLTAVLTVAFVVSGLLQGPIDSSRLSLAVVLVAANTLPLLFVRRNPLLVLAVLGVAYPTWVYLDFPTDLLQSLPTFAAMYAAGAWDRPLWLRSLGLLSPVWMLAAVASSTWDVSLLEIGYVAVMFVVVWVLGVVVAGRQAYARDLETRTAELEAARRELADKAVADERTRIARELHDVIAHAMSVITIQAGVGAHLIDRNPAQAGMALGIIERTGRDALAEMRRMLSVLREVDSGEPGDRPQPGLADLPRLVQHARDAGPTLTLTTRGLPQDLSAGLEVTVYRVVQEAVTNIAKHAPGSHGVVTVIHERDGLVVDVRNPVRGALRAPTPAGLGIRGMAERVALYDGHLDTGLDDGHFHVTATFPRHHRGEEVESTEFGATSDTGGVGDPLSTSAPTP